MGQQDQIGPGLRWGAGCLVAAAAMVGAVILLMYVAFTFDLPVWAQRLLGVGLTLGGALLAWLVVSALAQNRQKHTPPVAPVPDQPPVPEQPPPGETGSE